MKLNLKNLPWIAILALPLLCGCLVMGGGETTVFNESERISVRFANQAAAEAFYAGMSIADRSDYTDGGGFMVLFLAGGGGSSFYETHFYNAQVRRADIDCDREITVEEAQAYQRAVHAKKE